MGKSGGASRKPADDSALPRYSRYGRLLGRPAGSAIPRSTALAEKGRQRMENAITQAMRGRVTRAQYERQIIEPIAKRLEGDPQWQRLAERIRSGSVGDTPHSLRSPTATTKDIVEHLIDRWTVGSETETARAVAQAAMKEFNLSDTRAVTRDAAVQTRLAQDYGDVEAGLQHFTRAVYDQTQAWLSRRGITSVRLYRGSAEAAPLRTGAVRHGALALRPLTSWSTRFETAAEFGTLHEGRGQVQAVDVPASRIFSMPLTGPGEASKYEALVLGGSYHGAATTVPFTGSLAQWYRDTNTAERRLGVQLDGRSYGG